MQTGEHAYACDPARGGDAFDQLVEELLDVVEMPRSTPQFIQRREVQAGLARWRRLPHRAGGALQPQQTQLLLGLIQ